MYEVYTLWCVIVSDVIRICVEIMKHEIYAHRIYILQAFNLI